MNPSYSSGSSDSNANIPGAKPGVIASGPAPEDAPTPQPLGVPTPTMTPRRKLRLPTGGRNNASGGNNFVVNNPNDNRGRGPKKGLIIGGLAVVVILIVVLVVMMMGGGKGGGGNGSTGDVNYDKFLRYANYLLNGTENTNKLGTFDDSKDYVVAQKYAEKDNSFFNKAQELWSLFYESFIDSDGYSKISEIAGDVEYQNQLMDFIIKYLAFTEWEGEDLLDLYLRSGVDNGNNEIDEHYAALLDTTFDEGRDYVTSSVNRVKKALELFSVYDSVGCIVNGEVDNTCVSRNNAAVSQQQAEYNLRNSLVDYAIIDKTIFRLEEFCFRIDEDFRSKNES